MDQHPRVVLAERDALARSLLRWVCAGDGLHVVGETTTAVGVLELCRTEQPDVALLAGAVAAAELDSVLDAILATGARVAVVSSDPSPERVTALLERGVSGYLRQDVSPRQLADALHAVAGGAVALHPAAAGTILEQWRLLRDAHGPCSLVPRVTLTRRERDVLAAMTEGMSGKAIARHLGVALKTVENHKIHIFDKLGVRTQAHAVSLAIGQGLLAPVERAPAPVGV